MKLYIFACLCSLILWGVSCNEESAGIPTGSLFLGIEEDATLLTKAESAVTNESLRVDIIAAEGDTIKSYSDYIDEVKGKKIDPFPAAKLPRDRLPRAFERRPDEGDGARHVNELRYQLRCGSQCR